ncbi:hypothetical protein Scep_000035 [Stephania cephalantha]|uniref:Uncharacterized protein n=1 Tax=Stephania cephalantha TaxID=152367 RepID=A0AAP0Q3R3_9MAGN
MARSDQLCSGGPAARVRATMAAAAGRGAVTGSSTCADSGSSEGSGAALGVGRGPAAARLQRRGDDSGATR